MVVDWIYAPPYYVGKSTYGTYYKASSSDYTTVLLPLERYQLSGLSVYKQVHFQAMALVGNDFPTTLEEGNVYGFEGVESEWSNIQTLTIIDYTLTIIMAIILTVTIAVGVVAYFYFKKRKKRQIETD